MSSRRERKVVSVLFADLVGFTARAESLDPEDVEAFLRPLHERLRAELERYGGTVEKFAGDAVLALFGAPVAHEDDAERAVRAALEILDWARESGEVEIRVGVTTGEALVSLDARPEAGEAMASGDVVNTASRLQAAAPANGALVDETTRRATERAIAYREHQAVEAKGKAQPIVTWEAIEARSRFGLDVVQQAQTPLVGRTDELEVLAGALGRARREREPQLVTLVGVPGIGKSRLVAELFRAVDDDPELIVWRQGRSLPYGEGATFWALAEMVKAQAGILETDSAGQAREKLQRATGSVVEDAAEARWVESHLRPLVGLGGEGEPAGDRRAEAFAAWRRFFELLAEHEPVVLVFEDLHWADDGILDFIDELADWASGVPLFVVCTARPELLVRRPGWGGGKPNATTISLAPLSEDETARLVHGLLERAVLPARLQSTLLERAGGNPLYAEEFARMVEARGSLDESELPLPESLQGIIAARLDALAADEKALVQHAAVIGKVFWPGALAALGGSERGALEQQLHALERRQFVRRERRSSVAAERQYAFLHLLVRDVAYGQIPRAERADKHRLAAEWIESLSADRSEDRAEMLAHHYLAALDLAGVTGIDTGALIGPARVALREAGDRAFALNAFAAAHRFYEAALDLAPENDRDRPSLLFDREQASHFLGGGDLDTLQEAVAGLLAAGEIERAAEAELLSALILWGRGQREGSDEHSDRALGLIEGAPASPAKAWVLAQRSRLQMLAGEDDEALGLGRDALALADELGLDEVRSFALNNLGTIRSRLGDPDGLDDLERSLTIALELNAIWSIHRTYNNIMECYRRVGRWSKASETLAAMRRADERFGFRLGLRWTTGEEAVDRYVRGDWAEALERAHELIAEAEGGEPHYLELSCRLVRAAIRFACGDDAGADADGARAVELAREQKDPQVVFPALAERAFVLVRLGRRREAEPLAREALMLAPPFFTGLVPLAWAVNELGLAGDLVDALQRDFTPWREAALAIAADRFDRAADVLAEVGAVADEAYASLRAARAVGDAGNRAEADRRLRRALDFYRSVGATRYVQEGELLLAKSA